MDDEKAGKWIDWIFGTIFVLCLFALGVGYAYGLGKQDADGWWQKHTAGTAQTRCTVYGQCVDWDENGKVVREYRCEVPAFTGADGASQQTTGNCSPAISGSSNDVKITCSDQ